MASVQNKLQELLADLNISQHFLAILDECGINFVDLLNITIDQLYEYLEPTKIPWDYSVLHELISSWRSRNESRIISFLTSLKQEYRLRLTGEANIASSSGASTEITCESIQYDPNLSHVSSSEASDETDPDYQHGSTSTNCVTPEHATVSSPASVNEPVAAIKTTSPAVDSEADTFDAPTTDAPCCRSVEADEIKREKLTQNESKIDSFVTSREPGYDLRFTREAIVVPSSVALTETTRKTNLGNQRFYQISSNEAANGNHPDYQLPSTSGSSRYGQFTQGFGLVAPHAHVNQEVTGNVDAIKATANTDTLDETLADGTCPSEKFEDSLVEAEENQQRSALPLRQINPNTFGESSATTATITLPPDGSNVFTTKTLEKLLRKSEEVGKEIVECAAKAELSETNQQELTSIIAKHHLNTRSQLRTEDLRTYALAVTSLFKFERLETYFIPRGGDRKNHGGKIANKIGNLQSKKRKRETKENEYQASQQAPVDPQADRNVAAEEAAEWLMLNSEPWSVVLDRWKISYEARKGDLLSRKRIPQIFTTYPQYKCQHGFQLIDIDFQKAFPTAENGLKQLTHLVPQITEYISKRAVDPSAVSLLERLTDEGVNNDKKICTLLLALNAVLPPITVASRFKPTILVGQEDTLIFVNSKDHAQAKIQETYRSYTELDLPIVPKLVAVGENLDQLQGTFIVWYGDVCYELQSASRAVDVLIKLTAVLGLPFSKISKLVWHFLSGYIYGIKQRESYASINKLQAYLEAKKANIKL